MKKLTFILFLFSSFLLQSQENKLLDKIRQLDTSKSQLKYILNLTIDSIPEDGFSKLLKIKLNSKLDNLGDVFAFYSDGSELELSRKEQSVLENRVLYFARWFVNNNRYAIVKHTDRGTPAIGVSLDTIAEKQVAVLVMGHDRKTTERDRRLDYIYDLFNSKVRNLLFQ